MPLILDGTKGETFPSWTTATRPATPNTGQTGYNTTLGLLETYNGTAWVNTGNKNSITQTIYTSGSGTYTTPAGVTWLRVRMVGGGGGGYGGGTTGSAPTAGGTTTFGSVASAYGGAVGGTYGTNGGLGGTATISGPTGVSLSGGCGASSTYYNSALFAVGGMGGSSAFGGAGYGGYANQAGYAGSANTGGGGGGGATGAANVPSGCGGGSGGYVDCIISSPAATYSYAVGAGGNAGSAGTSAFAGGAGGSGVIIIEEHYNW